MIDKRFNRQVLLISMSLTGCAGFSPDGGLDKVSAMTRERMAVAAAPIRSEQEAARVADEVNRLLAAPLDVDSAVRIAILNNRGLQASLAGLGIAEADRVQAGRLRNPGFTYARTAGGGEREYERAFLFDLMGLLTLSARSGIEQRRFEAAQLSVADDVLRLAQTARQGWFAAVAARQSARYQDDVAQAAEAGAELAKRMAEQGNFSRQRLQREQLLHAEMAADLVRARQDESSAREHLVRVLGLTSGQRGFVLPERLPDLPAGPMPEPDLAKQLLDRRLDLQLARAELDGLAKNLGLTGTTRFVNVLEAGYLSSNASGEAHQHGYEIELSLPVFDRGDARTARAQAMYQQALHRTASLALNAESELRDAYAAYRTAFDLARRYRDEIVPLRKSLAEESLLRYNGMLIGVWELLADTRQQTAGVNAAIQAQKDFWLAESRLQMTLNGRVEDNAAPPTAAPRAAEPTGGH